MPRPNFSRSAKLLCVTAVVSSLAACTSTTTLQPDLDFAPPDPGATILLMPVDVELAELSVGGLLEPKSHWTNQAREHLEAALNDALSTRAGNFATYRSPDGSTFTVDPAHFELVKLHETVGDTIVRHKFTAVTPLPTKTGFDWGLGPNIKLLGDEYDADYVLFVTVHDSFSSAGRVAAQVAMAILIGHVMPGGQQRAFASLVEAETGQIIGFARLASSVGDVRDETGARDAITSLLEDLPL